MTTVGRKADHLRIAAGQDVAHAGGTGFEQLRLRHRALPERDLAAVSLETELLGARLGAPLIVSAMTGGDRRGRARSTRGWPARRASTGSGWCSARAGRCSTTRRSSPPTAAPTGRRCCSATSAPPRSRLHDAPERAARLVDLLGADGLTVHLNAIQEAVQPEGEPQFAGVAAGSPRSSRHLAPLPVLVKEVGFGMDAADVALLRDAGVAAIDVAGAGGTNWALVEGRRDERAGDVAAAFADWGVATAEALVEARAAAPGPAADRQRRRCATVSTPPRRSRSGRPPPASPAPFLLGAQADTASETAATLVRQLRVAVWAAGAASASELGPEHLRAPLLPS